jgi:cyclopropane fatty-acyl-phospholipid synthase-like methyltransferase
MFKNLIAAQFKKPSGPFGIFSSNIMIKGNKGKYEKLIEDLDLQPGDKLLEIGYGPGVGINTIAKRCISCIIHGIDFSKLMYRRASKYNKQYIDNNTMVLQYGDFLKTPVVSNEYDKIFCLNVVYFWNELHEPFKKVLSLLKPAGAFYIYMANKDALKKAPDSVFNKYSIDQVVEELKSVGFRNVEHYSEKGYYIKAKK